MQQLSINLIIPIPTDSVLISKVELQELKQQSLTGVYWNMKDLKIRVNKSSRWIKENILFMPKFKTILDVKNDGLVYYPQNQVQTWYSNMQ
ncbi:MAG TPA: DUF771 domain-containing protein [Bacillales bacterium]|nr:DUF771 domain-containing protein [Bacillales bacterium]